MGKKQKKNFFLEKKNQNGRLKKSAFFKIANSQEQTPRVLEFKLAGLNFQYNYIVLLSAWTGPFSTEASGTYQPALFKTITDGDTAVIFTVRASNDVHVGYFSELKTYGNGGGLYEIVIGGWRVEGEQK